MAEFKHTTVLLNETVSNLNIDPDGVYVDCTLGGGGHSELILSSLGENGRLIGIDQDSEAISAAKKRLEKFGARFIPYHSNFENIKNVLADLGIGKVNGIIADLGVSSYQLDNAERGFSFMADSALDMRMNQNDRLSAYDVVNTYTEEKLADILFDYGEEKWAKRIAQFIVKERENAPIKTTLELVEVIKKAVPKGARQEGKHPATRTFQAIRIEVNHELDVLKHALDDFCDLLEENGRVCIITFHSLEDRLVKNTFKDLATGCTCSKEFPVCVCGKKPKVKIVTRKPILPSDEEIEANPRSRSAKLRVIEKI